MQFCFQSKRHYFTLSATIDTIDDSAIWTRFSAAWWLAKKDNALHEFNSLVNFNLCNLGFGPPTSYCDDKTAWEMTCIIANKFRRLLQDRILQSPYYGIMVDETTDNSTTQQLIIYGKYLDRDVEGKLIVVVKYLDLISPKSGSAEDLKVSFFLY